MDRGLRVWWKGKPIRIHESCYLRSTENYNRGELGGGVSRALKSEINDTATVVFSENYLKQSDNMRKSGKTRLYVLWRIGYRRLKREHGTDEVREKAAEIWKLTSQEKADMEDDKRNVLSESFVKRFKDLMDGWSEYFTDEEKSVVDLVLAKAEQFRLISASEHEIDEFLDDITPVRLRIRKLTPRECGRLMDVKDEDIDKMMAKRIVVKKGVEVEEQILSNSALYKLFGNSIVVSCMEKQFEQLFYPKGQNNAQLKQLNLFGW